MTARFRSASPAPTGMLRMCYSEEAAGRFGDGITLIRGSALRSAQGRCSSLAAGLGMVTPLPFSLLPSSIPKAPFEASKFNPGTLGGFIPFTRPISKFAFKLANLVIRGIRWSKAILHGYAIERRRGISWFPPHSCTRALFGLSPFLVDPIPVLTMFTLRLLTIARLRPGRQLEAQGLLTAWEGEAPVKAAGMRIPACAEKSHAGTSSSKA